IGQKHMPDLIGMFDDWNPNIFLARVDVNEETKINRSGRFRKKRKVHTVAQPGRAKWIRIAEPSLYRRHKRAAFIGHGTRIGNSGFDVDPTCALSSCRCTSAPAEYRKGLNDLPARPFFLQETAMRLSNPLVLAALYGLSELYLALTRR